jgi:hypothetical protein
MSFLDKLDHLMSRIDELERERPAGYDDRSDGDEARAWLGVAHKSYDQGNRQKTWFEIQHIEAVLFSWQRQLDRSVELYDEISKILVVATA